MTKLSENNPQGTVNIDDRMLGTVICHNCGTKDNYRNVTVDRIDYLETEKERICNNCNELMDYWAYGHWESNCT